MRRLTVNDILQATPCPDCKGIGSVRETRSHSWFWCSKCSGTGRIVKGGKRRHWEWVYIAAVGNWGPSTRLSGTPQAATNLMDTPNMWDDNLWLPEDEHVGQRGWGQE